MLSTVLPLNIISSATDSTNTEQSVDYNATNIMGEIIQQAMESETAENNGYFVQEVTVEGFTATALISAPDDSTLVIAVYDEINGAMITSGKAEVDSNTESAVVLLGECEMPEYFLIKAFLLDDANAPVCKNFEGFEYTAAHQEFLSKTVYDFKDETVVNFDSSYDNNFAVVTDEAVNVEQTESVNILVLNDYENGIYVFENADDTIKSLNEGEVFYYEYGNGEDDYILTKVGTVEIDGSTVTITASDDFEISDFFSYIKIDTTKPYTEIETQSLSTMAAFDDEQGTLDKTISHSISVDKEYELSENTEVSFNGELKLEFYLKFYYDFKLFKEDYYELTYQTTVSFDGSTEIKAEAEKEFEPLIFFQGGIPIYPGLEAEVEVKLTIKLSASIAVSGGFEFKVVSGARKIAGKDKEDLSKKPSINLKFMIEGKAAFDIIPSISAGIKVLKVFKIQAVVQADFEISAMAKIIEVNTEERKKHSCAMCIDGDINISVSGNIKFSFGLNKVKQNTILDLNLFTVKRKLGDFYISFIENNNGSYTFFRFGLGECPNISSGNSGNLSGITASGTCGNNLTWVLYNNGEAVISGRGELPYLYMNGYESSAISLKILSGITSIGDWSLYGFTSIQSVTIPNSVKKIGEGAFYNCSCLRSITIPNSVTSIGAFAFQSCTSLRNITIPNSVNSIGEWAFEGCTSLTGITFPYSLTSINNGVLSNCSSVSGIVIPDSVRSIGASAFYGCTSLTSATIPYSVTSIDDYAFKNCTSLKNITIPEGIKSIGYYMFDSCTSLQSITIPNSVNEIKRFAFYGCCNLTDVYYSGSKTQWNSITIGADNECLITATIRCNYEQVATTSYTSYPMMITAAVPEYEVFTASTDNIIVGNEYLILVLGRLDKKIDLLADNLLYIGQQKANTSNISFDFIPKSSDIEMVVIIGDFGEGNEMVFANEWVPEFTVTWNVEGVTTLQTVVFGETITVPDIPEKNGYFFAGWSPQIPDSMPAHDMIFTAKFADYDVSKIKITITTPETRTVAYRESITLYANATNLPDGAKIKWSTDSNDVSLEVSSDGRRCTVTSISNGNVVISAYIVDANGNVITNEKGVRIADYEGITSEVTLWSMILHMFKQLFEGNPVFKYIFRDLFD